VGATICTRLHAVQGGIGEAFVVDVIVASVC
jgi:hypothetical protein